MVSVGVSRMGKTIVVFVEPRAKVYSEYYCNQVLRQGLLPDIQATCGRHNWKLQQDGAPSHTARNTINFLHQENIAFIEPNMWPPNSPDLNPRPNLSHPKIVFRKRQPGLMKKVLLYYPLSI